MRKSANKTDAELLKAKKAEGNEEEEEGQEAEGEGGEEGKEEGEPMEKVKKGCGTKKSTDLTEDDLQKSLDKLESLATEGDGVSRKQALLTKAQEEELDKSEQDELYQLLGGSDKGKEEDLGKSVTKGLTENETIQKALDVSDFLQEHTSELVKSLNALSERIESDGSRQHEFNLVLAKAVAETGKLVKAVSERLGVIESQPARGPKSRGAAPLEKSFAGQPPAGSNLSKGQILDALDEMVQESLTKGMGGSTEDGTDLVLASSKYEQFNAINPRLLSQVQAHIEKKGATAH